jgi:type VI secretion system protein ImpG
MLMQSHGHRLRELFQRELQALRDAGREFAHAFPAEAAVLELTATGSRDPQIEMLIHSFAFLTGRVLHEMESSKAFLANSLIGQMYPHLATPTPCMAVTQLNVRPDISDGAVLERGRQMSAVAFNDLGQRVECKYRTTSAVPLYPLTVDEVEILQPQKFPGHIRDESILSAVRLCIRRCGLDPVKTLRPRRLRLYIDQTQKNAAVLFELMALNLVGISVARIEDSAVTTEVTGELGWCGFSNEDAALPGKPNMHPGHRLLQEYFAFPEKFMFIETPILDFSGLDEGFNLYFHFNQPVAASLRTSNQAIKLNCAPIINLFTQRLDPLRLDHSRYEYPLTADIQNHRHCEVHTILELNSIKPDGTLRLLRPYFELESIAKLETQDFFYAVRHEEVPIDQHDNSDLRVSFLDSSLQPAVPAPEVIAGRALCTNGRLPERIGTDQPLQLEGPSPITSIKFVSRPTAYHVPATKGSQPWAMASQLALNHLSLSDGPQALAALKSMLRDHVGSAQLEGIRQIDGVQKVQCHHVLRPLVRQGMRGLVQGISVEMTLDRTHFGAFGIVPFALVIRHFLSLYASVNETVELKLFTTDTKNLIKQWPPMAGGRIVL